MHPANLNPKETLAYWIRERESVRIAKENGLPKPWSQDRVFQTTYFCNVRREDDRVTRWIRQNWSPEFVGWDDYEYAMIVARFLNWPDTLNYLSNIKRLGGEHYRWLDPRNIERILMDLATDGTKVWGNAYVVTTHGLPMGKAQYLCQRVLPAAYDAVGANMWRTYYHTSGCTLAQRYEDYIKLEGMGSFMSAQVLADLKNTPGHPLYEADDWSEWCAPGPGSLRGLTWFYGDKEGAGKFYERIEGVRLYLQGNHPDAALLLMNQQKDGQMNMQDLQNCLCEYDKYMRVSTGSGRSKRGYPGK